MRLFIAGLRLFGKVPVAVLFRFFIIKIKLSFNGRRRQGVSFSCYSLGEAVLDGYVEAWSKKKPAVVLNLDALQDSFVDASDRTALKQFADDVCEHRFDLLGSGPVVVGYGTRQPDQQSSKWHGADYTDEERSIKEIMSALLGEAKMPGTLEGDSFRVALEGYRPIDWHADFKAGYRFNPQVKSTEIKLRFTAPGVDLKVPWELSRCQHFGPLAIACKVTGQKQYAKEYILQVTDWVASNPCGYGVNWRCTMDVAIRAANWLLAWHLLKDDFTENIDFRHLLLKSVQEHALFISKELEYVSRGYHGNHYLSNVAGLVCIGVFAPEIVDSDRLLVFGLQELINEMRCQVNPDGSGFEGSIGYHCLIAEMFYFCTALILALPLERRERLRGYKPDKHKKEPWLRPPAEQEFDLESDYIFPQWYLNRLELMADFICDLSKPGGQLPQFGDIDSGHFYCLSPEFTYGRETQATDGRNVLALAGKLFGRPDFVTAGGSYRLDAELLLGKRKGLPRSGLVKGDRAAGRELKSKWAGPKAKGVKSETVILIKSESDQEIKSEQRYCYYPDSGMAVYRQSGCYLAVTCSKNGMNGIGGHSHNDKLSFEMCAGGKDFIVDGGSYLYTADPGMRNRFRSTQAHNTVVIPGKEQNFIIEDQLFVLPDQARARVLCADASQFVGTHRGYGFNHTRALVVDSTGIKISDYLDRACEACLVFNLHPAVTVSQESDYSLRLENDGFAIWLQHKKMSLMEVRSGYYSPHYGRRVSNRQIVIPF